MSFVINEMPFILLEDKHFILSLDESIGRSLKDIIKDFENNTKTFWQEWCMYVNLPFEFQKEVLRSSMIIRISAFDESGGLLNCMTTSIAHKLNQDICDMRFCWLKDSHFTVRVLGKMSMITTVTEYIFFLTNIV